MSQVLPPLAVSLGDPAGVGPELIATAWAQREVAGVGPFFVTGGAAVLAAAANLHGLSSPIARIHDPAEAIAAFGRGVPVLGDEDGDYTPGVPEEAGAALAMSSLAMAVRLALTGRASAVVTAPVAKTQLAKVGFEFPGQTEFLAFACGVAAESTVMMLAGPNLRTIPVTVHCALADVPHRLSTDLIVQKGRIAAAALRRDFGIATPRLAVCGLNPHAGEGGLMGREDGDIVAPAVAQMVAEGIAATGPHPADALFARRNRASYDAALAMYHDQALIPVKALDFDEGVNVTLGLPIVRTSPDHGTAFGIAGKSTAEPGAMIAALRMASEIAAQRAGHG